jgi:hypothetical protein
MQLDLASHRSGRGNEAVFGRRTTLAASPAFGGIGSYDQSHGYG